MVRFPHFIEYTPLAALPQGQEWADVADMEPVLLPCRMQPQGGGDNTVASEDGAMVTFTDIIYLEKGAPHAAFGGFVSVYGDKAKAELLGTRTVKRFFSGQLHTRIWV